MSREKKNTSWGKVADWYDSVVEVEGSYQKELILPNLLRLAGDVKEKHVLDVACGQGMFARAFRDAGANVVATDISPELIELAQKHSSTGIDFKVAPADELSFATEPFDLVCIVLALQNIAVPDKVFASLSTVVKIGGRVLIVLNHPAFRIPKDSSWGYDEEKNMQYRRLDTYMSEKRIPIAMHPSLNVPHRHVGRTNSSNEFVLGKEISEVTFSFHRPLQFYFKLFHKYGFAVTRLEEWISGKESEKGPRQKAENIARKEFPLFLALELARKS